MLRNTSQLELQGRVGLVCVREIGTWFAMACACVFAVVPEVFPAGAAGRRRDSGEKLEDKPQESASSDTEPEEPAGPAGINAVGTQHDVCARFLTDCLVCSGACVGHGHHQARRRG